MFRGERKLSGTQLGAVYVTFFWSRSWLNYARVLRTRAKLNLKVTDELVYWQRKTEARRAFRLVLRK